MKQSDRILELLKLREGEWVPLPDILKLGIAQYNARIKELRADLATQGYKIRNRWEFVDGQKHSWYMYARLSQKEEQLILI